MTAAQCVAKFEETKKYGIDADNAHSGLMKHVQRQFLQVDMFVTCAQRRNSLLDKIKESRELHAM